MQTQQTDTDYTYNVHVKRSNNTVVNLPTPTGRRHGHLQPLHRRQRQHRRELWKRYTTLAVSN